MTWDVANGSGQRPGAALATALAGADHLISSPHDFDAASADREFTIASSD